MKTREIPANWRCPEEVWEVLKDLIPAEPEKLKGGRPRANARAVADGIFYVLRTGLLWKALPPCFPSSSTCHKYFQIWGEKQVFEELWRRGLGKYLYRKGIDWNKLNLDTSHVKAPLGGEKNRPFPRGQEKVRKQKIPAGWRKGSAFASDSSSGQSPWYQDSRRNIDLTTYPWVSSKMYSLCR